MKATKQKQKNTTIFLHKLKNIFTPTAPGDFQTLHTDLHAHLLPGLDDGPATMEEALDLIRGLVDLGYRRLIATPHVMSDLYPNTIVDIENKHQQVQRGLRQAGIDVQLGVAAEYLLDEGFSELLESDRLLPLPGRRLLVEFGFIAAPPNLHQLLFRLQTKGWRPVIAHPERYDYYHGDLAAFRKLRERGCRFQVNLLSLTGYYGGDVQRCAERLLRAGLVDYLGTDAHHQRHLERLREGVESGKLGKVVGKYGFLNAQL